MSQWVNPMAKFPGSAPGWNHHHIGASLGGSRRRRRDRVALEREAFVPAAGAGHRGREARLRIQRRRRGSTVEEPVARAQHPALEINGGGLRTGRGRQRERDEQKGGTAAAAAARVFQASAVGGAQVRHGHGRRWRARGEILERLWAGSAAQIGRASCRERVSDQV